MKKSELTEILRRARRELYDALAGIAPDELVRPKAVNGGTIVNLAGHIAAWDEEAVRVLQAFAMQENPIFSYTISPDRDFAVYNAEQRTRRQAQTMEEALREMEAARRDLIQVIDGLTDQVLKREKRTPWGDVVSGYQLLQAQSEHDLEHTRQLLAWRKKMDRWRRARAKLAVKRKIKTKP